MLEEVWNFAKTCKNKVEFIEKARAHFKLPEPEEEGGPPGELPTVNGVPDLLENQKVFEWAGISWGEAETFRLQKSLAKLAADSSAENLKFWGMIKGTQADYYIAEGTKEAEDDGEERGPEYEARGSGIN